MVFRTGSNAALGLQAFNLTDVDTVAKVPVGTVTRAFDPAINQEGEFIYLPGVANVVAGDAVVYDLNPAGPSITRLVENTFANSGRPVAWAVVAVVAGQYGWFQIGGTVTANAVAGTVAGNVMAHATTGSIANTANAGDQITGARVSTAVGTPAAGKSYLTVNRPTLQTQIT